MNNQPEALRLAKALEQGQYLLSVERDATAAELRRLYQLCMDQQGEIYALNMARSMEQKTAALVAAAEREILANWMRQHGFSTGQAYTTDSLLDRLGAEMVENVDAAVLAEREACAKLCDGLLANPHTGGGWSDAMIEAAAAIRARGQA